MCDCVCWLSEIVPAMRPTAMQAESETSVEILVSIVPRKLQPMLEYSWIRGDRDACNVSGLYKYVLVVSSVRLSRRLKVSSERTFAICYRLASLRGR